MTRRAAAALAGLVVLAILLRVGAIAYTHATSTPAEENRIIARNLAAGRGFAFTEFGVTGPTAIRGPAYPMLLAILGPDRVPLALAVNVLAGAASVMAGFFLARRLMPVFPAAAWMTAAMLAVWPTQLYAATLTQGLSIAVLLTLAALALAWRHTPAAALAGGLLAGLAALTEPALALPLVLVTIALAGSGWHGLVIQAVSFDVRETRLGVPNRATRNWQSSALFIAAGCVIVAPWLYRNAIVFGGPMPLTSNVWRDAFAANGPDLPVTYPTTFPVPLPEQWPVVKTRIEQLPPADFDRLKRPEAERTVLLRTWTLDWIGQHPGGYVHRCWTRLNSVFFGSYDHRFANRAWFALFYLPLLFPAIFSVVARHRSDLRTASMLFFAGLVLPLIFVMADARMIPLLNVPLFLAFAGTFYSGKPRMTKAAA